MLCSPNDILGVEYCKALTGSGIEPLALPRIGAAHDGGAGEYASASYLRRVLISGGDAGAYLTPEMRTGYTAERDAGRAPVTLFALERAVLARLRSMDEEDFARFDEGNEGMYRRFFAASRTAVGIEALLDAVKTKRYAYARLRRMMLAIILNVPPGARRHGVPYIRVLGMNEKGKQLLHEMRKKATLPILTKTSHVRELSHDAQRLMELEAKSTDLYALAYPNLAQSEGGNEWRTNPIII